MDADAGEASQNQSENLLLFSAEMVFWLILKVSIKSIAANKLRSFLTMLGVIIGVAAVIAMLGLGAGTQEKILESVGQMGANLLMIRGGQRGGSSGVYTGVQQNLTLEDAEAILSEVPEVDMIAPEVSDRQQIKYLNKNMRVNVLGVAVTYFPARNFIVEKGRQFSEPEVERMARVTILGPVAASELFGEADPIGETVKINGINFLVIGVTREKGDQGWMNPDETALVPYSTAMKQLLGQDYLDRIYCRVQTGADLNEASEKITAVMRRQHRLQTDMPDDFRIQNLQEIADSMSQVTDIFTQLLSGVAAVSLLVGGIGIMNIMLVTVTERTREIGVRKALGARNVDLMTQFLLEAVTLSLTGGALGAAFGVGLILIYNTLVEEIGSFYFSAKLELWPIALAFSFSVLVGIFFGWYPARKAARLDPIEALRYE